MLNVVIHGRVVAPLDDLNHKAANGFLPYRAVFWGRYMCAEGLGPRKTRRLRTPGSFPRRSGAVREDENCRRSSKGVISPQQISAARQRAQRLPSEEGKPLSARAFAQ